MADDRDMAENPRQGATGGHGGGSGPLGEARKRPVGLMVVAALSLAAAVVLLVLTFIGPKGAPRQDADAKLYAGVGGPFRMLDQDGRAVDRHVLDGKFSAIFFGYVTCPDVCPATLQTLGAAQAKLGAAADRFQVVFVSVDPKRDTPKLLKTYLTEPGFPPHAIGLTGAPEQVAALTKAYHVYYVYTPRTAAQGGGYDVSHSSAIYLADPSGRTIGVLVEAQGPEAMADQIRTAMRARG